jgi:two-component system chemotaxis response regulator CheB
MVEQAEKLEQALWTALRALEENAALARRMYERMGDRDHHDIAVRFRQRAEDAEHRA